MIAALHPNVVAPAPRITRADIVAPRGERLRFVAFCSADGCSNRAEAPEARACIRTDCALSCRHHDREGAL